MSDQADQVNKALIRAVCHPVGHEIIRVLAERGAASGKELAAALSKPRSTIGDQLRSLEADGLIESVAEERTRGTVERFFRLTGVTWGVEDEEMAHLGAAEKRQMALRTVRSTVADASAALASASPRRDEWCMGSLRVVVDLAGWKELTAVYRQAIDEVVRVREECAERMRAKPDGESVRALASLMLLELPEDL